MDIRIKAMIVLMPQEMIWKGGKITIQKFSEQIKEWKN